MAVKKASQGRREPVGSSFEVAPGQKPLLRASVPRFGFGADDGDIGSMTVPFRRATVGLAPVFGLSPATVAKQQRGPLVGTTINIDGAGPTRVTRQLGDMRGYAHRWQATSLAAEHPSTTAVLRCHGRYYPVVLDAPKYGLMSSAGSIGPLDALHIDANLVNAYPPRVGYAFELERARTAHATPRGHEHWRNAAALALGAPRSAIHISAHKDARDAQAGKINIAINRAFPSAGQVVNAGEGSAWRLPPRAEGEAPKDRALVLSRAVFHERDGGRRARRTLMQEATRLENSDRMAGLYQRYMRSRMYRRKGAAGFQTWASKLRVNGTVAKRLHKRDLELMSHYQGWGGGGSDEARSHAEGFMATFHLYPRPEDLDATFPLKTLGDRFRHAGPVHKKEITVRLVAYHASLTPRHQRAMLERVMSQESLEWLLRALVR